MSRSRLSPSTPGHHLGVAALALLVAAVPGAIATGASWAEPGHFAASPTGLSGPLVLTQLPDDTDLQSHGPVGGGMLRAPYGEGARLLRVSPDGSTRVISRGLHSACDPDVSFDATRILLAAKRTPDDDFNIYEMAVDGSNLRQITRNLGDCRSPAYQSTLYTIVSPKPWYQLTFVGSGAGARNEYGSRSSAAGPATNLYSCKLDGSGVRRLTFNLSSDMDPFGMPDGRLLLASWQRRTLDRGPLGRIGLFGVNTDGTDYALFAADEGRRIKHMPCTTSKGLAVFVEADKVPWDGAGYLSCVRMRRPLHSYRQITRESDGLFHSPSPLPDGDVLVSRRPPDGSRTHGVYRLDPLSGKAKRVFDDPRYHDVQAKLIQPRPLPDGRSSVVSEKEPHGKLYCLNVYISDLPPDRSWMPPGTIKRLRVLEGIPRRAGRPSGNLGRNTTPPPRPGSSLVAKLQLGNETAPLAARRILGEIPIGPDGSFNIEIPANTPIELQILDADGMALRSCGWIWAKNREPRGCIGCHEDPELTPENVLPRAVTVASIPLCLPPQRRRTVDFRRDVMPILSAKCVSCHNEGGTPPRLDDGFAAYVDPGKARTSRLIWQVFGRNTSRPWDPPAGHRVQKPQSACKARLLTEDEKRTLVEWIDLGARWDVTADPGNLPSKASNPPGEKK